MQGRFDEARVLLTEVGAHPRALAVHAALALDVGDAKAAARTAERVLRHVPASARTERLHALDVLHRARLELGRHEEAAELLAELRAIAAAVDTAPVRACALAAEGAAHAAAGDAERARRSLEEALDLHERSGGARYESARVRLELAKTLLALGDRSQADIELDTAREDFRELGAESRSLGAESLKRMAATAASAPPGGLTPREVEILKLVATGLSNRAIGRKLFVSELTVKRHVGNVLAKLDVPSRAAAAAYAAKSGLL
jgi:ATP/maltotriose-dependent transcriptional regulator MalT